MVKRYVLKLKTVPRYVKFLIALFLFSIIFLLLFFNLKKSVPLNPLDAPEINISLVSNVADVHSLTKTYIHSSSNYLKYNGFDLKLIDVSKTCDSCFTLSYSYRVNTTFLVKSIKGFNVILYVENSTVISERSIRVI